MPAVPTICSAENPPLSPISKPQQRCQPFPVEAHNDLTVDDSDGCACDAQTLQILHRGRILRHISGLKRDAMLGEELLHPTAKDSTRLAEEHHRLGHRHVLLTLDPLRTDPPAAGEMATPFVGQTLRERQEGSDAPVGDAVDHMPPLPPGRHEAAPLQACKVVRDPAARGTSDRDELRDCPLFSQECFKYIQARGIPQDPEIPRSRGQGR